MPTCSQTLLIEALAKVRDKLCAYGRLHPRAKGEPHGKCDCKYGANNVGRLTENGNGCPEIGDAIALLSLFTPLEFAVLQQRLDLGERGKLGPR